ncbi:hypothetical protein PM082_007841 [Marasmius tenuissimus]|nr:hypothetical protein PM082_007841 [Marasmius tenuissimus]
MSSNSPSPLPTVIMKTQAPLITITSRLLDRGFLVHTARPTLETQPVERLVVEIIDTILTSIIITKLVETRAPQPELPNTWQDGFRTFSDLLYMFSMAKDITVEQVSAVPVEPFLEHST